MVKTSHIKDKSFHMKKKNHLPFFLGQQQLCHRVHSPGDGQAAHRRGYGRLCDGPGVREDGEGLIES